MCMYTHISACLYNVELCALCLDIHCYIQCSSSMLTLQVLFFLCCAQVMLVMEFLPGGDLRDHLVKLREM